MSLIEEALKKHQSSGAASRLSSLAPPGLQTAARGTAEQPRSLGRRTYGDPANTVRVDFEALRANGLMAPEAQRQEIAHQFRTMKRPLIKQAFAPDAPQNGSSQRAIMVSSALPGDGKTFTSINLAMSLAMEKDYSILLVDGDVAKPHVSHTFGAADKPGLLDVLEDPSRPIESVILPTDVVGLSILPVGNQSRTATELLASARMQKIIGDLEKLDSNCIVLVDSSPILLTSEARVLASLFGQVVLVVCAAKTPREALLDAIQIIGQGPKLQLVLNQASHVGSVGGGYYGYGYGYGQTEGSGQQAET